jgi:hypothetical protein
MNFVTRYILKYCTSTVYFSALRVKNKQRDGVTNVHFFAGVLARLKTF